MSTKGVSEGSALRLSLAAMGIAKKLDAAIIPGSPRGRDIQPKELTDALATLDAQPREGDSASTGKLTPGETSRLLVRVVDTYGANMPPDTRKVLVEFAATQGVTSQLGRISPLQLSLAVATAKRGAGWLKTTSTDLTTWGLAGLKKETVETKQALKLLKEQRAGRKLTDEEQKFLDEQKVDAAQTAAAAVIAAIAPLGSVVVPVLAKKAVPEKYLPDGFQSPAKQGPADPKRE